MTIRPTVTVCYSNRIEHTRRDGYQILATQEWGLSLYQLTQLDHQGGGGGVSDALQQEFMEDQQSNKKLGSNCQDSRMIL